MTTALPIGSDRVTTDDATEVRSPYDGSLLGSIPVCGPAEVERAVAAASSALTLDFPAAERARVLDRAAEILRDDDRADAFARRLAAEAAKPLTQARGEVDRCAETFSFAAAEARTLSGEVLALDAHPAGVGRIGFTMRVPIGVVAAITPFNFPLNLVAHKIAPAIAAGCPVVLKVASSTPFSGIDLALMLLDECGLPAGFLNVVTGKGSEIGNPLVDHDDVKLVTFTGSPGAGWSIRERVPKKRVNLELGNNSPVIIEPDADLGAAAAAIASAGYSHAGQSCISVQRVLVHTSVADDLERRLAEQVRDLVVGDPLDEKTDVSALIDVDERDRVHTWIAEAVDAGAEVVVGGRIEDDVLLPTVLRNVTNDMKVCREEVFGPVVSIQRYATLDEAIAIANDTHYGLHAGIYTRDLGTAMAAAKRLDFGGVIVNDVPTWRADNMPYGGLRDSGNTREGPAHAVLEMTEIRSIVLNA